MAQEVTVQNFDEKVLKADKPVLVDFFATWCGPCKVMAPVVEELTGELAGKAEVYKVDIDENPDLVSKYGIMGVPTFIAFENGQVKNKAVGAQPKQSLIDML